MNIFKKCRVRKRTNAMSSARGAAAPAVSPAPFETKNFLLLLGRGRVGGSTPPLCSLIAAVPNAALRHPRRNRSTGDSDRESLDYR